MISRAGSLMLRRCLRRISKDLCKRKKRKQKRRKIKEGDVVNLSDLLFNKNRNRRDYLIKYNNNQRVKAEDLAGKVIVLYFVSLAWGDSWGEQTAKLVDIYNELQTKSCCFEVVFVAVWDTIPRSCSEIFNNRTPQDVFEEIFSTMPWTAVPFSDRDSRKSLEIRFGISSSKYTDPACFAIDPTGVVLDCYALSCFQSYGAAAYPFTNERIDFLISEDEAARSQPSMKALLTSAERDYVINNKGVKVPVHDLEDKVVALYFYSDGFNSDLIIKLKQVYEQLAKSMENFEVVLIYIYDSWDTYGFTNEETFWKCFKRMPWLALPFKDSDIKKLLRVFSFALQSLPDPALVIVGPHGSFIEPYGGDILMNFGCPAYPFTRKRAAELEAENIQKLKLDMFWKPDTIFRKKDGSIVRFSELVGKRVLLLFDDNDWVIRHHVFFEMLRARYLQMNDSDDEFEVIYIPYREQQGSSKNGNALPWLTHPPFDKASDTQKLVISVFRWAYGLLAFDCDGRVVRRTMIPTFEREDMDFPFYTGDLAKEALMEFKIRFGWEDDEESDDEWSDDI